MKFHRDGLLTNTDSKFDFMFDDERYVDFFKNIDYLILLGYGGSYAYGTNVETSDIDLRGIYLNSKDEILGCCPDKEQYDNTNLDIVVYSLRKIINLLRNCNPNVIEMLGLRREDYFFIGWGGDLLIENSSIFLSKKAIYTFGNYALSQLNRLTNKSGRANEDLKGNEVRSLNKMINDLNRRYRDYISDLTVTKEEDISLNIKADNIPIEKLTALLSELNNVHRDYIKSKRNDHAIAHNKLSKHMMHLLRLYMMGIDILENGIIKTYRDEEHDLLMSIRNGNYLVGEDKTTPSDEFINIILPEYKDRFDRACRNTKLPDLPDIKKISELETRIFEGYYYSIIR